MLVRTDSGLDLVPRWAARSMARRAVHNAVVAGSAQVWGELAAQPDRRRWIDGTLDSLEQCELSEQVQVALELAPSLGRTAALDSMFLAVARRGVALPGELAAAHISEVLFSAVFQGGQWPLCPATRGGPARAAETLEALVAGWTWSRLHEPPAKTVAEFTADIGRPGMGSDALGLLLPNWWAPSASRLSELLDCYLGTHRDGDERRRRSRPKVLYREVSFGLTAGRLASESGHFAPDLVGPWPESPAPWLVAGRLVAEDSAEWLTLSMVESMVTHDGVASWFISQLRDMDEDRSAWLAAEVMDRVLSGMRGLAALTDAFSRGIQESLLESAVEGLVQTHGYLWSDGFLSWVAVEPRLRRQIARVALAEPKRAGDYWRLLTDWCGGFGIDDVEILELIASSPDVAIPFAGAELWRIQPGRALALARDELLDRCPRGLVCRQARGRDLTMLLPELEDAVRDRPPPWLRPLLARFVAEGGVLGRLAFDAHLAARRAEDRRHAGPAGIRLRIPFAGLPKDVGKPEV